MKKDDFLFLFHSPSSSWGLRYRAQKLPRNNQYRMFLEAIAKGLDDKKLKQHEAVKIIDYWRDNLPVLATKMLIIATVEEPNKTELLKKLRQDGIGEAVMYLSKIEGMET